MAVQEFGLLVVIGAMMFAIWLFAGTIPAESVMLTDKSVLATTSEGVSVKWEDGTTTTYAKSAGYRYAEDRRGRRVERFEVVAAPPGAAVVQTTVKGTDRQGRVEEQGGFVFRSAGGDSRVYLFSAGWQQSESGEGLERPYQVSKFLNKGNLVLVLTTSSFYAIMAVGMTLIIIMGGIDLSIGSIYAVAAVSAALMLRGMQTGAADGGAISPWVSVPAAIFFCTLIGGMCGALNGVAIVGLRVHPFIITLGGMAVYRGIAFVLSEGQSIGGFPESFQSAIRTERWGINPVPALVMVLTGVVGAFIAVRTTFGRRTFAIGGNETAARYAGVPVGGMKIALYTIGGVMAGLAAAIGLGYFGSATSDSARGYELGVIAAAVVGGASLSGGRGSIFGAVLGAIIIQLIENGFDVLGIDTNYKQIVVGFSIVVAVLVDQLKQRLLARS